MKVELENVKPMDIEKRSFEIITEELGDKKLVPGTELIVKRMYSHRASLIMQRISVSLRMQLRKQLLLSKTVPAL
mgnify:CR=1 FL=1